MNSPLLDKSLDFATYLLLDILTFSIFGYSIQLGTIAAGVLLCVSSVLFLFVTKKKHIVYYK